MPEPPSTPLTVSFRCRNCERPTSVSLESVTGRLACGNCDCRYEIDTELARERPLTECLLCGCRELYIRKDFSQRLGLTIVVVGLLASSVAWAYHMTYTTYGILFATALIDVAVYLMVGNVLQCYRCRAEYRGIAAIEGHQPFNLETHERFRQQAARLEEQAGSADKSS